MRKRPLFLVILAGSLLLSAVVQPGAAQNRGAFSLNLENDVFAGTDKYYTHGTKLTWISPFLDRSAISVSLGQNIYTPVDTKREDLIENDRPYAGISYFTLALHRKRDRTMETVEFLLGIVGPSSLADRMQEFVHNLIHATKPRGWSNQLADEIVFDLVYDRKWRLLTPAETKKMTFDLIGHLGGSVGTMITAVATGWQFRFGWNLPDDFGTFLLRPGGESGALFNEQISHRVIAKRWGIHGYVYLVGHAVGRNIFLDGNTFQESHRVDKYPFVGDLILGCVITAGRFRFSYAYVFRTKQFRTQTDPQIFGALNISYIY